MYRCLSLGPGTTFNKYHYCSLSLSICKYIPRVLMNVIYQFLSLLILNTSVEVILIKLATLVAENCSSSVPVQGPFE